MKIFIEENMVYTYIPFLSFKVKTSLITIMSSSNTIYLIIYKK